MTDSIFQQILSNFHFLRPVYFLALLPLFALYLWLRSAATQQSGWQSVIPAHLYQHMLIGRTEKGKKPPLWIVALTWLLAVIALAGPTWERLPQPVYQVKMGHVIVLDMSLSMRATDMTPDRLTRAKYKAIDLVNAIGEGEMGLVAYAGDAFVISPLTQDASTITTLLPSLSPEIMPVAGSDPMLGIQRAAELLSSAGYPNGMIYWITDGIDFAQQQELQEYVSSLPFTVHALAVGTQEGAPIKQASGELLKDASGSIVIPKLNSSAVKGVVNASGGKFQQFSADDSDIAALSSISLLDREGEEGDANENNMSGDQWKEVGPYLLLLLLPFAMYAFRKGLVFVVVIGVLSSMTPQRSYAQDMDTNNAPTTDGVAWWKKPFVNNDQEGLANYEQNNYADAATLFETKAWQGAAQYKAGDYEAAYETFSDVEGVMGLYNQGNALAKLGKLKEAIAKYEDVLSIEPDHQNAQENKALVEALLEQQKQEQDQQEKGSEGEDQNSGEQDNSNQQEQGDDNAQGDNSDSNDQQQDGEQNSQQDNSQSQQEQTDTSNENQDAEKNENAQQAETDADNKEDARPTPSETNDENGDEAEQQVASPSDELTDEEKEEMQRMENLMRRVPDDPAFLLKRKMLLEAQKRKRQRMPSNRSDW